jgi:hypothetical protein
MCKCALAGAASHTINSRSPQEGLLGNICCRSKQHEFEIDNIVAGLFFQWSQSDVLHALGNAHFLTRKISPVKISGLSK